MADPIIDLVLGAQGGIGRQSGPQSGQQSGPQYGNSLLVPWGSASNLLPMMDTGYRPVPAPLPGPRATPKPMPRPMPVRPTNVAQDTEDSSLFQRALDGTGHLIYGLGKGAADTVQAIPQLALNTANFAAHHNPLVTASWNPMRDINQKAIDYLGEKTRQYNDYLDNQERVYQADTKGSIMAGVGRVTAGVAPVMLSGGATAAGEIPAALEAAAAAAERIPLARAMLNSGWSGAKLCSVRNYVRFVFRRRIYR